LRLGADLETASADEFLDAVLEDLATNISGTQPVSLEGLIDPIVIGARDATTLGILVSELVTNALKHAFPEGRAGRIVVTLRRSKEGVPTLSVVDDGIGMVNHEEPGDSGLGSVIVKQLAMQFGGSPSYSANSGGGLAVTLPLPSLESASTHPK
jgi:two-component sensor histidine kinase